MLTPPRTDDPSTRRPAAPFRLLIAFALCGACGGDSPSTPSSGAAPAAPAPAPPPTAPTVAAVSVLTAPFDSIGYVVGDTIRVQVTFNESVSVSGDPTLALTIGASDVPAAFDEEHSEGAFVAFRYDVRHGDGDEDGLSIAADALDLGDSHGPERRRCRRGCGPWRPRPRKPPESVGGGDPTATSLHG